MIEPSSVFPLPARHAVGALAASQIREVANAGMDNPDLLAFWFGEPDEVTPAFIRDAAAAALARGETFYTQNHGIPELREAIATYLSWLHRPTVAEEITVTASGMSALMLGVQALVDPGDRVAVVTPVWPNLTEIPKILGADVARVPLSYGRRGWALDMDRLIAALTPRTRLVLLNSPNNPTGWTLTALEQRAILEHCRRYGIWIIADDVYERLHYTDSGSAIACAPSFLDIATREDRLVSTNSFSKSWLMTGFLLGWMVAPPAMLPDLGKLVEYNTSCSPSFVQRAGVAAIRDGEPTVAHTLTRLREARDFLVRELNALPGVDVTAPPGAMYAFFRVDGMTDSLSLCKRLVREAKLGLAPGSAFGPEGEGFVRWCFAATGQRLGDGIDRLAQFLAKDRRSSASPRPGSLFEGTPARRSPG